MLKYKNFTVRLKRRFITIFRNNIVPLKERKEDPAKYKSKFSQVFAGYTFSATPEYKIHTWCVCLKEICH